MPDSPNHPEAVAVDLEEGERLLRDKEGGVYSLELADWLHENAESLLASVREAGELRKAIVADHAFKAAGGPSCVCEFCEPGGEEE